MQDSSSSTTKARVSAGKFNTEPKLPEKFELTN